MEWIRITTPDDVSVIAPTPGPAVTLVGCYPFYHVGSAPQRFIVRAVPEAGAGLRPTDPQARTQNGPARSAVRAATRRETMTAAS